MIVVQPAMLLDAVQTVDGLINRQLMADTSI